MKRNPYRVQARDFINDLFAGVYQNISVVIDESCKNLIKDYNELRDGLDGYVKEYEKDDGVRFERIGHCYDSSVYFIVKILEVLFNKKQ